MMNISSDQTFVRKRSKLNIKNFSRTSLFDWLLLKTLKNKIFFTSYFKGPGCNIFVYLLI